VCPSSGSNHPRWAAFVVNCGACGLGSTYGLGTACHPRRCFFIFRYTAVVFRTLSWATLVSFCCLHYLPCSLLLAIPASSYPCRDGLPTSASSRRCCRSLHWHRLSLLVLRYAGVVLRRCGLSYAGVVTMSRRMMRTAAVGDGMVVVVVAWGVVGAV
jgi:hypothetical protein